MLTIKPIANADAAVRYFRDHLSVGDNYYAKGQAEEVAAQWQGRGKELLGLPDEVTPEHFERLMHNQHPLTGQRLSPRNKQDSIPGYEVTTDLPKWATLMCEVGGDERIMEIDREAWAKTLQKMEDDDMQTRVRVGGADHTRHTANLLCAPFEHIDTRRLGDGTTDPHRHRHAVIFSQTFDPEERKWKRGYFREMKRNAPYYQAYYHMLQAEGFRKAGYAIERDGIGYQVVGIEEALQDKFSRRTALIEATAKERNITDPKRKAELGKQTRNKKREGVSDDQRRSEWVDRCTPEELGFLQTASQRIAKGNETTPKEAMDYALWHCFDKKSAVPEKTILAEAMMQAVGSASSPEDIHAEFEKRKPGLILKDRQGVAYVSLPKIKAAEDRVIDYVSQGRGSCSQLGKEIPGLYEGLGKDQTQAARTLINSRNKVSALEGPAGSGKTHMMKEAVRKGIEAAGRELHAFAPSSEASRTNLREAGFSDADTVQMLLTNQKMQREVKGQVLWVDEAGLLDVDSMNKVFELAERLDCRVILSGDTAQHSPVGRGDALKLIKDYSGLKFAELTETRRQKNRDYLTAVEMIRAGRMEEAVVKLDKIGGIVEIQDRDARLTQLANDYVDAVSQRRANGDFKTGLVVAPTNAEADQVNDYIRAGLKDLGRISREDHELDQLKPLRWSDAERTQARQYKPGTVVRFNQKVAGFEPAERVVVTGRKGNTVTVKKANQSAAVLPLDKAADFEVYRATKFEVAAGDKVRITKNGYLLDGRKKVKVDNRRIFEAENVLKDGSIKTTSGLVIPADYGYLAHAYTSTSYSAQGPTFDHVFSSMSYDALVAADKKQWYVSLSRGRDSVRVYTDNRQELLEAVKRPGERLTASELIDRPKIEAREEKQRVEAQTWRDRARRTYQTLRRQAREIYQQMSRRKEPMYAR